MPSYSNLDGIMTKRFHFGYGKDGLIVTFNPETGVLSFEKVTKTYDDAGAEVNPLGLLIDGNLQQTGMPRQNTDLVNLQALTNTIAAYDGEIKYYIAQQVKDVTGGVGPTNVMLDPHLLTTAEVESTLELEDRRISLGLLEANKFVDRLIIEVNSAIDLGVPNATHSISIGSFDSPELLLPKTSLADLALQGKKVVEICRTFTTANTFYVYVYEDLREATDVPEDYTQEVKNDHPNVATKVVHDSSYKVWEYTFTGGQSEQELTPEIKDKDLFGEVEGDYMDFSFSVPVPSSKKLRIVQYNSALELYNGKDEFVKFEGGQWVKDKTYENIEDDENFFYAFLLGQSTGDNDWAHVYVYNPDGATPELAIRTYHIKNELNFIAAATPTPLLQTEFDESNRSYASAGIVKNEDNSFTVTLSGEIPDETAENLTFGVFYPREIPEEGCKVVVYSPGFEALASEQELDIKSEQGVYYTENIVKPEAEHSDAFGMWIDVAISKATAYPIVVIVSDLATNESFVVGIDNELVFLPPVVEEEEEEQGLTVTLQANVLPTAVALTTGSMWIRILSF